MASESTIRGMVAFASRIEGIDAELLRDGFELARLHRLVEYKIETDLAEWGLTARQVEILEALYFNMGSLLTPADLSDEVGLTRSAMTSALDSLEKNDHIVRRPHPHDRRMLAIGLTQAGRTFLEARLVDRYRKVSSFVNLMTSEERGGMRRSYTKMIDYFETQQAEEA